MYLERFPRYKNYKPRHIRTFEEYYEWKRDKEGQKYSFNEWSGMNERSLPAAEDREYFEKLIETRYWVWDEEHRHPHDRVYEQVAYWRKANAIHKWFVDRVQFGEDDCEYHDEVTKKVLEELRDVCAEVLEKSVLVNGKVINGYRWTGKGEEPIFEDGLVVADSSVCEELLPVQHGFFFGSYQYNEWYIQDVRYTYEVCCKLLEETDFENQMIYYISSW